MQFAAFSTSHIDGFSNIAPYEDAKLLAVKRMPYSRVVNSVMWG